ncbi:MAG: hypothetical protein PW788_10840 [Micavibrio sp.]|nr:hypothetical protein [Micavibrio sp.]
MTIKIAAFGALNPDSYDEFASCLAREMAKLGLGYDLASAAPYPNAEAVSAPGRPLRAEALQDPAKKQQLLAAVAADAAAVGAASADICVMPCMSMIGFHDDVEKTLGKNILGLAAALAQKYAGIEKLGVIHMRPARQRIVEIFDGKATVPDEAQAAALLSAEDAAKAAKSPAPVEAVMQTITESWQRAGLEHILFARADAPKARHSAAGSVARVKILSHFDILAEAAAKQAALLQA